MNNILDGDEPHEPSVLGLLLGLGAEAATCAMFFNGYWGWGIIASIFAVAGICSGCRDTDVGMFGSWCLTSFALAIVAFATDHWGWGIIALLATGITGVCMLIVFVFKRTVEAVEDLAKIAIPVIDAAVKEAEACTRDIQKWWKSLPESDKRAILRGVSSLAKVGSAVAGAHHRHHLHHRDVD